MTREEAIALLDPELTLYLDRPAEDLASIPLPLARAKAEAEMARMFAPPSRLPMVVSVVGLFDQPCVDVRVHLPLSNSPVLAIFHVHGGGMVKGSARALDGRMCELAQKLNCVIVSVAYRLAPETPFPGALYDCVAGWNWMISHAADWGLCAEHCIISGDSAGGGLAAATTIYLRDTSGTMPKGQVLVYPMLDYLTGKGEAEHTDQRLGWTSSNNQFGWRALLGDQSLPEGERLGHFSPAHAPSLAGLPPTWIGVGTIDLFCAENVRFSARLADAGVEISLCVYKGAPHGFPILPSRVSRRYYHDYYGAFARFLL